MSAAPLPQKRDPITDPFLLLADGASDSAFFRALFKEEGINDITVENPEEGIESALGLQGYIDYLSGLIIRSRTNLRGFIITRDCDDSSISALTDLQAKLTAAGYTPPAKALDIVPPTTSANGESLPSITIMLIPWTGGVGCLETLLLPAAYTKWHHLVPCVDDFCRCLNTGSWDINRQSKIRMRSLLSSAYPRNPSFSLARIWTDAALRLPLNEPCFVPIVDFVRDFCGKV